MSADDRYVSYKTAALLIGVDVTTIEHAIETRELRSIVGRQGPRVRRLDLGRYVLDHPKG